MIIWNLSEGILSRSKCLKQSRLGIDKGKAIALDFARC